MECKVTSVKRGVQSVKSKNVFFKVRGVGCKVWSVKLRVRSEEFKVLSVKCGV